ncbi:MAG: DAK2 domain-containing protein [Chloroflexi bacterium]|nr:DAK2 domain-containing protein [Chloroflexota bacterium]
MTSETLHTPTKWRTCNGQQFKKLARAGLFWLEKHQQIVNALNVFPVPDGDTGTNMLLTMRSAWRNIQDSSEEHVGKLAQKFSKGALMGARGNSGVILSQIWRGMAQALEHEAELSAADLGRAFQQASDTAYKGVMKPVEGTILTVIREGAEEALDAAAKSDDLRFVLRRAITRCGQALERTPELLPILKQAGVVDSGGQGLIFVLEGMYKYATGELTERDWDTAEASFEAAVAALPAQAHAVPEGGVLENHYDVQFIIMGQNLNVEEVRRTIDAMGDSTVVVGDETTIKVHVHVDNPGEPISYGVSLGEITDVVVENMQMQMDEIVSGGGTAALTPLPIATVRVGEGQIAVVAVAAGEGLGDLFRDMGAAGIVPGGQTNNPSTEEILAVVDGLPTDKIILLPNNKNIVLACEAARDLSDKQIMVVPTRTAPQGISAMLALNADGELAEVAQAMGALAQQVTTAEITIATRSVEIDGVAVAEGNVIGLLDGKLRAAGEDVETVLAHLLAAVEDLEERELVTLFYGADVSDEDAAEVAEQITTAYPELEVEVQAGGQPYYFYILGIE